MLLAPILMWVRGNWQLVAIGAAVLALVGYITFLKLEVRHYKNNYQDVLLELSSAKAREAQLEESNRGITRKYESSLVEVNRLIDETTKEIKEVIRDDKELGSTRISVNAARLFNKSKRNPSAPTPDTKQGNAVEASTPEAPANSASVRLPQSIPLTDLFTVSAENDSNHWKCIKQVEDWQRFWNDYSQAVVKASE